MLFMVVVVMAVRLMMTLVLLQPLGALVPISMPSTGTNTTITTTTTCAAAAAATIGFNTCVVICGSNLLCEL